MQRRFGKDIASDKLLRRLSFASSFAVNFCTLTGDNVVGIHFQAHFFKQLFRQIYKHVLKKYVYAFQYLFFNFDTKKWRLNLLIINFIN